MKSFSKLVATATATAFLMAAGATVAEERVTISSWTSPKHPTSKGHQSYADLTEAAFPDAFDFKVFNGGALLGAKPTLSGLRDGVAQMGILALTYFKAELPYAQMVADMALMGDNQYVMTGATSEFVMLNCAPCLEEFSKNGIVMLGGLSTAPYVLISKEPIVTIEDMQGVKLRTGGSAWDRWAVTVGATPVGVPTSEMHDALGHGVVNAAVQPVGALKSHSLIDVAKHLTTLPLGTYHSAGNFFVGKSFWDGLSDEQKTQLMANIPLASALTEKGYGDVDEEVLIEAAGLGLTVHEPSPELLANITAFRTADLADIAKIASEKHGIDNPAPLLETYVALIEKWNGLVEPIGNDTDAFAALLEQEIYSKIDFTKYPN
ncbi:MAG: C4-dicarboxylate TRAP transporter substrate-binding protein [Rhodobacteraceae bacterium]|nr:C4-dicarboxylate TRAP transporter substrate-binding protein [Paracoccaceae bacterium]